MALLGTVHYEVRGDVALLRIDNPPVNPLSSGVRFYLSQHMETALADDAVKAIVITGEGRAFVAGADIRDFGNAADPSEQPKRPAGEYIEESTKPVVAAINGTAFGGGLELALTCHYRVAKPGAEVGLPEVKIGLLPGGGGTQRLPRLIGAGPAAMAILIGDPFDTESALAAGVVDAILAEDDFVGAAVAYASKLAADGAPLRLVRDMTEQTSRDRANPDVLKEAQNYVTGRMRGQFNGQMCLDSVRASLEVDNFDAGIAAERANFQRCLEHPQRAAMIHAFFAERKAQKIADVPASTPKRTIKLAGTVGGGLMGGGIAMNFANVGIPVKILEQNQEALDKGLATIESNYARQVKRGRLAQADMDARMACITGVLEYEALGDVDVVIEAVYENLDVKKEVFAKLDKVAKPGAILASNTSALDVDQMAEATGRPEDVVGMHFFSPANVMRLLEVVRGKKTAKDVLATVFALGKTIEKAPVLSANAPGFIGNRMLGGYTQQAAEMILRGALPHQVDQVITEFGMPMGPFQMNDLVGLDLGWRARKLAGTERKDMPPTVLVADELAELGRFGQKTGRGFYLYDENRRPTPDPEVAEIIARVSAELGYERKDLSDEDVLKRCLYPLVNIGAGLIDDGIAQRPSDIDITYLYGYGFPKYRGGPMYWADEIGLEQVLNDLKELHQQEGGFWRPAALLQRLVSEGKRFADLND